MAEIGLGANHATGRWGTTPSTNSQPREWLPKGSTTRLVPGQRADVRVIHYMRECMGHTLSSMTMAVQQNKRITSDVDGLRPGQLLSVFTTAKSQA